MRLIVLSFFLSFALSTTSNAQQYDWNAFLSPEGYNDMLDDGYFLWLATDAGVIRLDKQTFDKTYYTPINSDLPSFHVQSITRDAAGDIWIGTYDAILARFNGTDWGNYIYPNHVDIDPTPGEFLLYDFALSDIYNIWVGTNQGLLRYTNNTWELKHHDHGIPSMFEIWAVDMISPDKVNVLSNFVFQFEGNEWSNLTDTTTIFFYGAGESHMAQDGKYWVADHSVGVSYLENGHWTTFPITEEAYWSPHTPNTMLTGFAEDPAGNIYLATEGGGVYQLQGQTWVKQIPASWVDPNNFMEHFYIDPSGAEWVTQHNNLHRLSNDVVSTTDLSAYPISSNHTQRIREDAQGRIYILTLNPKTITVYGQGNWSLLSIPLLEAYDHFTIQDILIRDDQHIYVSTDQGIFYFDGIEWTQHTAMVDGQNYYLFDKLAYHDGLLYISSPNGFFTFDGLEFVQKNSDNTPMNQNAVGDLTIDHAGNIWLRCGLYELWKIEDGVWTSFENPVLEGTHAEMQVAPNNDVWIQRWNENNVAYFDGQSWSEINPNNSGLRDSPVYSISISETGAVYFAHEDGFSIFDGNEWRFISIESTPLYSAYHANIKVDGFNNLWVASYGQGLFLGKLLIPTNTNTLEAKRTTIEAIPNPTTTQVTLRYHLAETSSVHVAILNPLGEQILSKNCGKRPAGVGTELFDLHALPAGIYFAKLSFNQAEEIIRIVKH